MEGFDFLKGFDEFRESLVKVRLWIGLMGRMDSYLGLRFAFNFSSEEAILF